MKKQSHSADVPDLITVQGTGSKSHQHAADGAGRLTAAQGIVIADNQNSLRMSAPGPTLPETFVLREIFRVDHKPTPERLRPESFTDHYSQA